MTLDDHVIADAILAQLKARGLGKTICPSEAARTLSEDWRSLMPRVRDVADTLADRGLLIVTQKGEPVRARQARGPIRLGLSPRLPG